MLQALIQHSGETVQMDEESERHFLTLKRFLFEAVYKNPVAKGEEGKPGTLCGTCSPTMWPIRISCRISTAASRRRRPQPGPAADFISGMSDRYCVDLYEGMVIPRSWPVL